MQAPALWRLHSLQQIPNNGNIPGRYCLFGDNLEIVSMIFCCMDMCSPANELSTYTILCLKQNFTKYLLKN